MQYIQSGEYLGVVRITGPTHNLLQVRLQRAVQGTPVCERLPPVGPAVRKALSESAIMASVLAGVALANERRGSGYAVTHIRYMPDDSGPESMYCELACGIVEHLVSGGAFQPSSQVGPHAA
jgi:hypothetical protein